MVGYDPSGSQPELPKHAYSIAGASSGLMTRCVAQPLDVVKIRFQLQVEPIKKNHSSKYHGILQAYSAIYKEEGLRAFWKGHVPAQGLSLVYGLVQFTVFEVLTRKVWTFLPGYFTTDLKPATHFVCGGISGCMATIAGQPFDVIRTRFVAQGEPRIYNSVVDAAQSMVRTEGVRALYKGLVPTLIQIAPQTGFQFGFYSMFKSMWLITFGKEEKSSFASFRSIVCGAGAGLCSKMIIYPLDMVKKRLQVQGFESGRSKFGHTHKYNGMLHCMRTITLQEGIFGFYKGLSPSLLKAVVTVSFHFWSYEWCCHLLRAYYQT